MAALLSVRSGYETAVAAALGSAADAVAVADADAAVAAIGHLKTHDLGRAGLVLGGGPTDATTDGDWPGLPGHAAYAVDSVDCPADLRPALARLLFKVAVVDDLGAARALVADLPDVTAVTRDGDLIGPHLAAGGSSSQPSLLEIQAAVDEATGSLAEAVAVSERLGFDISRLESERLDAQQRVDVALAKLHESDATLAAVAEQLGQHGSQSRSARAEAERVTAAITTAEAARDQDLAGLADLESRLTAAEDATDEEPDTSERERLVEAARTARAGEMDGRLALRTAEERARALHGRADSLLARGRGRARGQGPRRRAPASGCCVRAGRPRRSPPPSSWCWPGSRSRSTWPPRPVPPSRRPVRSASATCSASARQLRELAQQHDELVGSVHRDELARTQQKMRIEQLAERAIDELGLDIDALVADYGPDNLVPATGPDDEGNLHEPVPYVREEQQKRLRSAERSLAMLGRVNPLALEEFSAMEERHKFLTEQLEDLKRTRKDLLDIVREVDNRVQQVFAEAYADVAAAFEATFTRLFPGGEGRLVLTDPDDMLNTGVEVEARPPGKRVKRLSLLSGGERSLVAVAFLVALFKARPSPFYILDEVEAALDDTNLSRLLEIYEELRESSQLLIITHQKRTMEVGDALYGVAMRGDGVSAVISQRLREAEPA